MSTSLPGNKPNETPAPADQGGSTIGSDERDGRVAVGICTANRPDQLRALLGGLSRLHIVERDPDRVTVIVADNSADASAKEVVAAFSAESDCDVEYHHVTERGLSSVRNHVLDAAFRRADLLAFIDDDEVPEPHWLDRLLECRRSTSAPMITGPVFPLLCPSAPGWLVEGGFLELATYPDRTPLREGISGNALLHLPTLRSVGIRFDERYSRTGGEDQLFFREAFARGLEIRYAAHATVHESVPPERATFGYLARRELRKGNTLGLLARDHRQLGEGPARRIAAAAKWMVTGVFMALGGVVCGNWILARRGVLRSIRAVGMIGGLGRWRYIAY